MSNFGFLRLRVVNPYKLPFREARSAVDASELMAQAEEYESLAEAIADCALVVGTTAVGQRDLQHPLQVLESGARLIQDQLSTGRVALLFGSEKFGLSNESLSHCHWLMRIPTRDEHRSMNLGQSAAICLYQISRANTGQESTQQGHQDRAAANTQQLERITAVLLETLLESGYLNSGPAARNKEKVRRLVRRLPLQSDDAELLLGMLRQIAWKLRSSTKSADGSNES